MVITSIDGIDFVTVTKEIAHEYYGGAPAATFRGIAAMKDGEPIGIGGLHYDGTMVVAFSEMKPEMRKHKKAMAKACRLIVKMARDMKVPVVTAANPDEPTSGPLLKKLGFRKTGLKGGAGDILILGDE